MLSSFLASGLKQVKLNNLNFLGMPVRGFAYH
jgi:hypothetical protein